MELGWHNKPLKFVPVAKKRGLYGTTYAAIDQ